MKKKNESSVETEQAAVEKQDAAIVEQVDGALAAESVEKVAASNTEVSEVAGGAQVEETADAAKAELPIATDSTDAPPETDEEKAARISTKVAKHLVKKSVSYLAKISMLAALAVILLMLEFPFLPAVPHLKLNISDAPALIAAYMFGPISGIVVNGVKIGIGLLIRGTSTGFVGDLSNLVSGTIYAGVAGLIYMFKKNKFGAILSLAISSVLFCGAMWLCNQFFLLPMYGIKDKAVAMPMLWWTLLFNFIKTVLTSVVTFFVYKSVHKLFNRF